MRWAAGAVLGLLGAALFLAGCSSTGPSGAPSPPPPRPAVPVASAAPTVAPARAPPTHAPAVSPPPPRPAVPVASAAPTIAPARAPSTHAPAASPPPTAAAPAPSPTPQPVSAGLQTDAGSAGGVSPSLGQDDGSTGEPDVGRAKPGAARQVKGGAGSTPVQGTVYTWQDGDRTERVLQQADLVVQGTDENRADDEVVTRGDTESIVRKQPRHDEADARPVFRSPAGDLMTLPGGVLLALDAGWDRARVDRFFSENDIDRSRVEERDFAVNAFFVTTQPGFPSLDLANELAAADGVLISSPNWRAETVLR